MTICKPLAMELIGFNRDGIHVGSAKFNASGKWSVYIFNCGCLVVTTAEDAAQLLHYYGVATIQSSDGNKC